MALLNRNDLEVFRGDSLNLNLTFRNKDGTYFPIDGSTIYFTVKLASSDVDSSAVIQKIVTEHTSSSTSLIRVASSDTEIDLGTYVYDVQVVSSDADVTTIVKSNFIIIDDVTKSS